MFFYKIYVLQTTTRVLLTLVVVIILFGIIYYNLLPIYAQIEASNEYGKISVEQEVFEIKPGESKLIKIIGQIENPSKGGLVTVMMTDPNDTSSGQRLVTTEDGYFEYYIRVDDETILGTYKILASYNNLIIGTISFVIEEKKFTEQEISEIRNATKQQMTELEPEPEQQEESEIKELSPEQKEKIIKLNVEAGAFYDSKNYAAAIEKYSEILEIDPTNTEALNRKGLSYLFSGRPEVASYYFNKAILIDPTFAKPYYNLALVYDELGQKETSLSYFDKALEADPSFTSAILGKGLTLFLYGKYTEAIIELDRLLKIEPNNLDALSGKALALNYRNMNNDQYDALLAINKVLQQDYDYPNALQNKKVILNTIGIELYNNHEFKKSISYFDEIIAIDSQNFDAYHNKALSLYYLDDFDNSLINYDKALNINPNSKIALTGKGTTLNELGRFSEAIVFFDKALAIDPNYNTAIQNRQFSFQEINKINQQKQREEQIRLQNNILTSIGFVAAIGTGVAVIVMRRKKSQVKSVPSDDTQIWK